MSPYPTRWAVERGLLVAVTLAMALGASAALELEAGRLLFVGAGFVSALLVGLAWYRGEVSAREVLVVAVLLRLVAFPLLPGLSDDGFRYLWDGLLQAEGLSPYAFRPSDPALSTFREGPLYEYLNSKGYYSVYPPAAQLVFLLGGVFGWPAGWYVLKAVFVGLEMAGVWALVRMAPARWALLYAWHPLVVVEVAGQAHTEAGMVGVLLLSVLAARRERPRSAIAALTVAGWFKLYPLALLPFLLRRVGWRHGWVAGAVSLVLCAPYAHVDVLAHVAESLDLYVRSFEFFAGPYYALKYLGYALIGEDVSKALGPALRAVFLVGLGVLFWADRGRRLSLPGVWLVALTMLWATATTVHPWYLLGVLALLPLMHRREGHWQAGWHVLALGAMGTYLFYSHGLVVYWTAVWAGWLGWLALLVYNPLLQQVLESRGRQKWKRLETHAPPCRRLLDLGAGEGYVGRAAQRATHAEVVLADVADFNRTPLPLVVYDGRRLPFEDDAFDVTLLVFVLHHATDPAVVLREARRVTRHRVLVLESVFEGTWDRWWLGVADRLANRLRGGNVMRDQEQHLQFRRASEWRRMFVKTGFRIAVEEQRGGWWHRQHLFVLTQDYPLLQC